MKNPRCLALVALLSLAVLSLGVLVLFAPIAQADPGTIIRVKTTGAPDGSCGDDWANACSLQRALSIASSGDEIWVASGIYTPGVLITATFQLTNGVALRGGFPAAGGGLADRNVAANQTILSGDLKGDDSGDVKFGNSNRSDNSYHVVTGSETDNTAVLDGFTVTGGNAAGPWPDPSCRGGGMYNVGGRPTLSNVTFISNTASYHGGGMYNDGGSPVLTNVSFTSNIVGSHGGGMHNTNGSSPALTNGTFNGNSADYGAGMDNYSSSPTLTDVTFSGNSAGHGGGMYNDMSSSPVLTHVAFTSNAASGYGGGGMYNTNSSSPTVTDVAFSSNSADQGGGMYNYESSSPVLTDVAFTFNFAYMGGGGMYNWHSSPTLTNVTFSSNSEINYGGAGMYNSNNSSPALTNVTFASNLTAAGGGAMYNASSSPTLVNVTFRDNSAATASSMWNHTIPGWPLSNPVIRNTIFWNYTAPGGVQIVNDAYSVSTISHSIVQGGYAGGTEMTDADPRLGPLDDYGGSTQTVPLLPGSAAIDAGDDTTCAAAPVNDLDQRGIKRSEQGAHCDIGAYESRGFTLAKSGGDAQSAILSTAFGQALQTTFSEVGGGGLPGIVVTYTAPASGARATWNGSTTITRTTGTEGVAMAPPALATGGIGPYVVTASAAGISSPLSFSLTNLKANTATTLTSSPNPSKVGASVVFTVTVSVMPPASGTPTGTVELFETTSPSAPTRNIRQALAAQPLVNGVATFSFSSLATGTHSLLAVYSGDGQNQASTSSVHSHVVGPTALFKLNLPIVGR